jgi:hypothetical protein
LKAVQPALAEALKLVDRPNGRHRITYLPNPILTLLKDQQETRRVSHLLTWEALRCDEKGDAKGAVAACRAVLNAARSIGDEPFLVSQLIRIAGVHKACFAVERTLAQGEVAVEDLRTLQAAFTQEAGHSELATGVRGERGMMHQLFEAVENGDLTFSQALGEPARGSWDEKVLFWRYRNLVRADHPTYLAFMTRSLEVAKLPFEQQEAAEQAFRRDVRDLPKEAIMTRLLVPPLDKVGDAGRRKQAYVRSLTAALAAERYRRAQGHWPATLDALVPDLLPEVPRDPYDGNPLRYRRLADGVVIYSISRDHIDDGGTFDRGNTLGPNTDIGIRLWDVKQRRQPPKPAPAAPPGKAPR